MNKIKVAVTIDVHPGDDPNAIHACNEFFSRRGIPVTFLMSTAILERKEAAQALLELSTGFHEIGTHTHKHDYQEICALQNGNGSSLGFLEESTRRFEDFFGLSPKSFRSPAWCGLGPRALDELVRLNYRVDSSATPQRPGVLSSFPLESPWLLSKRSPHWIANGLLEIPTSCLLFPLATPSFATFRKWGSHAFLNLFLAEANIFQNRIIVLVFDTPDFDPNRPEQAKSYRLRQLIPTKFGGLEWRWWLRTYNPAELLAIESSVIDRFSRVRFVRLSEVHSQMVEQVKS